MPIITLGLKSVTGPAPIIGGNSVTSISNSCTAIMSGAVLVILAGPAFAEDRSALERRVDRISHTELDLPWLRGDANIWSGAASAVLAGIALDRASADSPHGGLSVDTDIGGSVEKLGDDLQSLATVAGYITSLTAKDYRGFVYMGLHNVVSSGTTKMLKSGIDQSRPGDQDNNSFPSGHTNTAFLGAAFLQQRYGSAWGLPSYVSAIIVGWSRVYANKHYANDVITSASIAMLSAWAIVPPYDTERAARWRDLERMRRFRFEWEMTLSDVNRNEVRAPLGTGDSFVSPFDRDANEPWANSHVGIEYRIDDRRSVHGVFSPWETRSYGQFTEPTNFANVLFPANEDLRVAHLMWTFGAQYRHVLVSTGWFNARWGFGVSGQYTEEEIFVVDETLPEKRGLSAASDAHAWFGVVHLDADLKLVWKLHLAAEFDYGMASSNEFFDWSAQLKARLNNKWDVSLGWREFETDLKDNDLRNDFKRSGLALNIGYAF